MIDRDDYDMAFAPATEKQVADLEHELKMAQIRAADAGDRENALARKLKALQAQEPTLAMVEAGRNYLWEHERSSTVAINPSCELVDKLYRAMREAV